VLGCSLQLASCAAPVTHGRLGCICLSHTPATGARADTPCWFTYGQQCREGAQSSAPAATPSRNRQSACGKASRDVMLGHSSFSSPTNSPRNVVRGLCMVPCTDTAQNLTTSVLSRASSVLVVCLFQRFQLLYPTMRFALQRQL